MPQKKNRRVGKPVEQNTTVDVDVVDSSGQTEKGKEKLILVPIE